MGGNNKNKAQQTQNDLSQDNGSSSSTTVQCDDDQTGAIQVTVADSGGTGIAAVQITGPGTKPTDGSGQASFDNLAPGSYTVTVTTPLASPAGDDYFMPTKSASKKVQVAAGQTVPVAFVVKKRPTPSISVDAPKIVIVKHDYHGKKKPGVKPHRIEVELDYDGDHDGVGELSCAQAAQIKIYDKETSTSAKSLPWSIKAASLKGKTVYLEGIKESGALSGTELKLTLKNGTIPPKVAEATEKITCLLLQLNVYKSRPEDNSDPDMIAEGPKIEPGRSVIVQGASDKLAFAHRAKLVVMQAKPAAYAGKLILKPIAGNLDLFGDADEVPANGQTVLAGAALESPNPSIDSANGKIYFVQGNAMSAAFGDTGWTVEAEDVPGQEGDRVTMTALKAELRLFKSQPEDKSPPVALSGDDKIDTGRFVQKQDPDNLQGRAKLVVRRLEPSGFAGKLSLSGWDLTHNPYSEAKSGAPKVKLFTSETGSSQFAFGATIDHSASGGAGDLKTLWVEGGTTSAALIDTQIRLNVVDVDFGCDRGNATVVEFQKIKATIKSTPANTVRAGYPAPADHTYENAKLTDDFSDGKNEPLVLIRNAQPDIELEVTVLPDLPVDLDIQWRAVRNPKDKSAIGGKNDLPTVTRDGANKRKATLDANAKGSFRIRPYIDCNGVDEYSPKEPSIPLNLVLADVVFVADNSAGLNANLESGLGDDFAYVVNGEWPGTWAACIAAKGAGMTMELVADVTGGGADGRLGLNKVFGGLINMLTDNQIALTYTEPPAPPPVGPPPPPPPPPPATYTIRNRYVLNRGDATGQYTLDPTDPSPMFLPSDTAPTVLAFPVLDTGRGSGGLGGESATMSRSGMWDKQANRPVGFRYTLRCIDSPGRSFLLTHPTHATAELTNIHYVQAFRANFCFWTNIEKDRDATGDPCDRVYSAVRTMDWEAHGDWSLAWAGGNPTLTNTNAHAIAISNPNTVSPIGRAQDNGVEVRPPSGITTAIAWVTT